MDFFDILLAKKLEDDRDPTIEGLSVTENGTYSETGKAYSPVIVAVEGFKKKSIANTPTDIASFDDGTANPMPSLEISIVPVQSGSGDPSPQNVRPISGWSGANVTRCGVNLWDEEWEVGTISIQDGSTILANDRIRSKYFIPCKPNTMYFYTVSVGNMTICFYDKNGNYLSYYDFNPIHNFTTPDGCCKMKFFTAGAYGATYNNDISINYPSTDTSYHAYNGSTLSIPFHDNSDNPITVYGGRLNVTSGELVVTHANIASYNGETINEPWISSMDVYSAGATPTTGAQVVYPLATPITYQLTPAQVTTLLGQNNIFADCGQILEGEYFVTL